jgi:transposase InsO family protein
LTHTTRLFTAPNEKWLTDITEFQIPAGKVYLSPMIDCFDGLVISWSIGTSPDADLVNTMLDAAVETVANGEGGAAEFLDYLEVVHVLV